MKYPKNTDLSVKIKEIEDKYSKTKLEDFSDFSKECSDLYNSLPDKLSFSHRSVKIKISETTFNKIKLGYIDPIFDIEFINIIVETDLLLNDHRGNILFSNSTIPNIDCSNGSNFSVEFRKCKILDLTIYLPSNIKIIGNKNQLRINFNTQCRIFKGFSFYNTSILFNILDATPKAVDSVYFLNCKISSPEGFQSFEFKNDVNFIDCNFEKLEQRFDSVYRKIKKEFYDLGNELAGNTFSALEMKCHHERLTFKNNFADKVIGTFYFLLNDFGLAPYRPIAWLILFGIAVFSVFHFQHPSIAQNNLEVFISGPFRLLSKDFSYAQITGISQVILNITSGLFWFFFILGIRKRFKIEKG